MLGITTDFQASIALAQGAIAPHDGDSSASLVMTPMAPGRTPALPSGLQMIGNVYRFTATYRPTGTPVSGLRQEGQLVLAYKIYRCWVSEYQALPELDANASAVAIQHLVLENEGWERDPDVVEPAEPAFTKPTK